jgi:methylenetetrahydrofolate dehydrogenase (NAD+)
MTQSKLMKKTDFAKVARDFTQELKLTIAKLNATINVAGIIATTDEPSLAYARATQRKFRELGINYDLRNIPRLALEQEIAILNADPNIHGIFIYFPIFFNQQDDYLRNLVDFKKDIEAGSQYWTHKLYQNDRFAISSENTKKALLPCTPLAIIKMLTAEGIYNHQANKKPVEDKVVTIFNRSEVIGRPLAVMMSNDGAKVYSFDENGPLLFENAKPYEVDIKRKDALAASDIVITGVPSEKFEPIRPEEVKSGAVCINFSSIPNFSAAFEQYDGTFIPRVGPMTVAMCIRNTVRLFKNFHQVDK